MRRLPFQVPETMRLQWASSGAQDEWEPRVSGIVYAKQQIEVLSVTAGVREASLQIVTPESLADKMQWWSQSGLHTLPLERLGRTPSAYSVGAVQVEPGQPWDYRVVVARNKTSAHRFVSAFADGGDDEEIGDLLGFPPCCRQFFDRVWNFENWIDTTWAMAADGKTDGPPEANILLRWIGVRMVPHLPCCFTCEGTIDLAKDLEAVAIENGFGGSFGDAREMLSWPIEWSALHGVAEIKTPVLKITTNTDATDEKITVRRNGTSYPPEGVRAHSFPFNAKQTMSQTPRNPMPFVDNEFGSLRAQREAHLGIIEVVEKVGHSLPGGLLLDLGCGNGDLVAACCAVVGRLVPWGCDIDEGKIERARGRHDEGLWVVGNLFTIELPEHAPVILMPGRLCEVDQELRTATVERLQDRTIIAYAYGDWLKPGGLLGLCQQAGLTWNPMTGVGGDGSTVEAVALRA